LLYHKNVPINKNILPGAYHTERMRGFASVHAPGDVRFYARHCSIDIGININHVSGSGWGEITIADPLSSFGHTRLFIILLSLFKCKNGITVKATSFWPQQIQILA